MRITQRTIAERLSSDIQRNLQNLQESQSQVSSGKRVLKASDDPGAMGLLMEYKVDLSQSQQISENIDNALAFLNTTEAALNDVDNLIARAKELAIKMSSDTVSEEDRLYASREIEQLMASVMQIANTSVGNQYIFGGTVTDEKPFEMVDGEVVYNGNSGSILRQIGEDETLQINLPGSDIFGDGENKLFGTLSQLKEKLALNDKGAIRDTIDELEAHHENLLEARSKIGAYSQRAQMSKDSMDAIRDQIEKLVSQIEDADLAESAMKLARNDNAYKAALLAASRLLQSSLLDYLS